MSTLLIPVLIASVAGSLHCGAMCGPFTGMTGAFGATRSVRGLCQASYHLGRLVSYSTLGVVAGSLGGALDLAGASVGFARTSAFIAGITLVLWGGWSLIPKANLVRLRLRAPSSMQAGLSRALVALRGQPPLLRGLLLGLTTTLIPCGWLYAFVAMAGASGKASAALGVMFVFWLGTLPLLVAVSFGFRAVTARIGPKIRTMSGLMIGAAGIALIWVRIGAPAAATPAAGAEVSVECPLHR